MDKNTKDLKKKNKKAVVTTIILTSLLVIVTSLAYFTPRITIFNNSNNTISGDVDSTTADITVTGLESAAINLTGTYPMTTATATETLDPLTFTITNNSTKLKAKYNIILDVKNGNTLTKNELISTSLGGVLTTGTEVNATDSGYSKGYIIYSGVLNPRETKEINLRVWINENGNNITGNANNVESKTWLGKVIVKASKGEKVPEPSEKALAALGLSLSDGTPDFTKTSCTKGTNNGGDCGEETVGIYSTQDDYGTSFYFRGDVTNNYVKFGKYPSTHATLANQDMYWRIVRINGDGSLRLIYDGTQSYTNGTSNTGRLALTSIAWNTTNYNDAKYVGYMYGGANGTASTSYEADLTKTDGTYAISTNAVYTSKTDTTNSTSTNIKTQLESWYADNLEETYGEYISDEIFCNDRTIQSGYGTELGYGGNQTGYGARSRLYPVASASPSLECTNQNDRFTVSDTENGNGALSKPIGLITGDEASFAGGAYGTANRSYYLYKGSWYWSFSPYYYINGIAYVVSVYSTGYITDNAVSSAGGVAPVINLSAEFVTNLEGDGTIGNEYHL